MYSDILFGAILYPLDEDVFQDEQCCKDVHCNVKFLEVSANKVDYYVSDHTQKDTV